MKYYKVLKQINDQLVSPYQDFVYEIGKEYVCENFDDSSESCAPGFYAGDIESCLYYGVYREDAVVVEVECSGKNKKIDPMKWRHEKSTIVRILDESEVRQLAEARTKEIGWDVLRALYPVDPLSIEPPEIGPKHLELLRQWASVWDSVGGSVRDSVRGSVRDSVWDSVRDSVWDSVRGSVWGSVWDSVRCSVWGSVWDSVGGSVRDSVRGSVRGSVWGSVWDSVGGSVRDSVWDSVGGSVGASVWVYTGSLFPNIDKWKSIDHAPGTYPFQPAVDLWHMGLVSSYDGELWRLHGGEKGEVLWEGKLQKG